MIKLKIMPEDGKPFVIVCTTRDIARWEKTTKGASFAGLQADMKVTDLYKIAWFAIERLGVDTGLPNATLRDFERDVDLDVLDMEDDDEPDPTRSAV